MTESEIRTEYGRTWDTEQLQTDFNVEGFGYGYCVATRKSDGQRGSLRFQHRPRLYYGWVSYD